MLYADSDIEKQYKGEWNDDKRHGHGELIYRNGDKYVGYFKEGMKNGKGRIIYSEHPLYEEYDGDWIEDKREGHGTLKLKNGGVYQGDFLNDMYNGFCSFSAGDAKH